jgi:hypothetical protein
MTENQIQTQAQELWDTLCDTIADSQATNDIILCVLCTLIIETAKQAKVDQVGLYKGLDHIWETWEEGVCH